MKPSSSSPAAERPRAAEAGFSLVEVLAAVVLTLALVAAVMPFAANVMNRWMTGQRQIEQADLWMRAIVRLMDDAGRALTLTMASDSDDPQVFFRGGERELVLVRPPLSAASPWPLEQVSYAVERSDDGEALVRRSGRYDPQGLGQPGTAYAASTTIVSGPYRFRFAYMTGNGAREPEWREKRVMPRLVELVVEATGSRAVPPAPIAMPILGAAPAGDDKSEDKPAEGGRDGGSGNGQGNGSGGGQRGG